MKYYEGIMYDRYIRNKEKIDGMQRSFTFVRVVPNDMQIWLDKSYEFLLPPKCRFEYNAKGYINWINIDRVHMSGRGIEGTFNDIIEAINIECEKRIKERIDE